LNSKVASYFLNALNPTVNFQVGDIIRIPYKTDLNKKSNIENLSNSIYNKSLIYWDSRETSWDFENSPVINDSSSLKSAYLNWQQTATQHFFQLHANEEELNKIFIEIYGLQDELTP